LSNTINLFLKNRKQILNDYYFETNKVVAYVYPFINKKVLLSY